MKLAREVNSPDSSRAELTRACMALWTATLALMTAFMHTGAPAHRYLMARRIARNFGTLREQDCFTPDCRETFSRLSVRWNNKADQLSRQEDRPRGGIGMLLLGWFSR